MWKEQIGKTHCVPRCVRLCQRLECFLRLVPFVKDRGSKSKNSLYPEKRLDDYTMSLFIPATIYWQCSVIARCLYGMTVIKWMTIFTDWKTALWGLKATSWMPHQIKAKSAAKEYRASLGKGYRPVASASCCVRRWCVSAQRTTSIPPGSQIEVWVAVSWEGLSAIIVKWNWPRKQTRSLPIYPSSPDQPLSGWWVFLLFCLFACLVWSPWIPSME